MFALLANKWYQQTTVRHEIELKKKIRVYFLLYAPPPFDGSDRRLVVLTFTRADQIGVILLYLLPRRGGRDLSAVASPFFLTKHVLKKVSAHRCRCVPRRGSALFLLFFFFFDNRGSALLVLHHAVRRRVGVQAVGIVARQSARGSRRLVRLPDSQLCCFHVKEFWCKFSVNFATRTTRLLPGDFFG